jgi:hypothetical protein
MFVTNQSNNSWQPFPILVLMLMASCVGEARGQQGGLNHPTMRDQVRAIQRAELDRILLTAVPAATDSEANRVAVQKQIREDFKDLQGLNNKMMAEAWARETLDYSFMSDMAARIRGKALRLKTNMDLPGAGKKAPPAIEAFDSREFRAALLVLDRTIMSFVTNPLFKEPKAIEVTQAIKARQDLESVIELTADLKKLASRLVKTPKSK